MYMYKVDTYVLSRAKNQINWLEFYAIHRQKHGVVVG